MNRLSVVKTVLILVGLVLFQQGLLAKELKHQHYPGNGIRVTVINDYGERFPLFPLRKYQYRDHKSSLTRKFYLEAVPQESYAIEIQNLTSRRIGVVVAVDGRNIITGKKSRLRSKEKKYILAPYQTSQYRGWRSSRHHINRFYFTDTDDSYSASFGDFSAMGVIAVAAFHEAYHEPPHEISGKRTEKHRPSEGHRSQHYDRGTAHSQEPGTGWGEEEHSRSRRVKFVALKHPFNKHLIKYEWRSQLCNKGIINCYRRDRGNRLWNEDFSYAPPPARRHRYSQEW